MPRGWCLLSTPSRCSLPAQFFHPRAERDARAARERNHLSNTGTGRKLSEAQDGFARAARMLFDGVRFQPGLTGRKLSQDSEVPKRMLFDGVRFQPGLTGRKLSDESDRSEPDVDFILD
jgi:hypothetical protein